MEINDVKQFNTNLSLGGFAKGAYDSYAIHPTTVNWTRQSRFNVPQSPLLKQEVKLNRLNVKTLPVANKDGMIIVGSDNELYSISQAGKIKSIFKCDKAIGTPCIGTGGYIFFGTTGAYNLGGHNVFCIDQNGKLIWEYGTTNHVKYPPVFDNDGNIYIITDKTRLIALDVSGREKWVFTKNLEFWSVPVISDTGNVYIGAGDKNIYLLDSNGAISWSKHVGHGRHQYSPIIDSEGNIYINASKSDGQSLLALKSDGTVKWGFLPRNGDIWTTPAISHSNRLYVAASKFRLISLDTDGKLIWETSANGFPLFPPIIGNDGTVLYVSYNSIDNKQLSYITAFNEDGVLKWEHSIDGLITCPVLVGNNNLCVIANNTKKNESRLIVIGDKAEI